MYLLQSGDYLRKEKQAILKSGLPFVNCSFDDLEKLNNADLIPVGTVEYINRYCAAHKIALPLNISYPFELAGYLSRTIRSETFGSAPSDKFVKPKKTKIFTGAIKSAITESVDPSEPVWVSDVVTFTSEYRVYVTDKKIAGYSRYDDGDDQDIEPDFDHVTRMIADYESQPIGYSIDVGICEGKTILIEVNDGWALGLYPWGTMTDMAYIDLITKRWRQITNDL